MPVSIDRFLAQQIVDTVQSVRGQTVNFIRQDGIIVASSCPESIGSMHEARRTAARAVLPASAWRPPIPRCGACRPMTWR